MEQQPGTPVSADEETAVRRLVYQAADILREQLPGVSAGDRVFAIVTLAPGRIGRVHVVGNATQDELASVLTYASEHLLNSPQAPPSVGPS